MKHNHCEHEVRYCEKCNVCYCTKCEKEWKELTWTEEKTPYHAFKTWQGDYYIQPVVTTKNCKHYLLGGQNEKG